MLREAGHLPALDVQTLTLGALQGDQPYRLVAEGGLRAAHDDDGAWLLGAQWLSLSRALADEAPLTATLQAAAALPGEQRAHLRQQIQRRAQTQTPKPCIGLGVPISAVV